MTSNTQIHEYPTLLAWYRFPFNNFNSPLANHLKRLHILRLVHIWFIRFPDLKRQIVKYFLQWNQNGQNLLVNGTANFKHVWKEGPSCSWSYGGWIYNYLCNRCLSPLILWVRLPLRARCTIWCDKVCQWLAESHWLSPGPSVSSTNKTYRHDITEILLKVALNAIKATNQSPFHNISCFGKYTLCF